MTYTEYEYTKIPFGKYKGKYLREVPIEYVKWATKNIEDRGTATMFATELQRRLREFR